ncbi:MAG: helix-turn-helix transcriptional regulator [Clostridium sp.]|uniref:helix-turn-helix domain-containing protein n=1 Tax=Clostridium sp. TaxID=1506 RepID=UPI0028FFE732|nr:helix-turn-helix transcriptional regulator [Clostridium sp.]MDU1231740.1 helix-turn-helix transcriptional regulator [Clostridium sp.]
MNIGERIKKLRKEKGLSVDYIAEKLGKNRATVYRYESSEIENLPYPILVPLADILGTTPMYLMGCEVEDIKVTKEEKQLLENYNKLDTNDKTKVIDYTNLLSNQDKYKSANKSASEITATTDNVVELDIQSSNSKNECYTLAAHDDDLNEETKKRNLEKVKNIFKQMDEE